MIYGFFGAIAVAAYVLSLLTGLGAVSITALRITYPHTGLPRLRDAATLAGTALILAAIAGFAAQVAL